MILVLFGAVTPFVSDLRCDACCCCCCPRRCDDDEEDDGGRCDCTFACPCPCPCVCFDCEGVTGVDCPVCDVVATV